MLQYCTSSGAAETGSYEMLQQPVLSCWKVSLHVKSLSEITVPCVSANSLTAHIDVPDDESRIRLKSLNVQCAS